MLANMRGPRDIWGITGLDASDRAAAGQKLTLGSGLSADFCSKILVKVAPVIFTPKWVKGRIAPALLFKVVSPQA
jgi:hypothetical protein